jgi:hypothetical protein
MITCNIVILFSGKVEDIWKIYVSNKSKSNQNILVPVTLYRFVSYDIGFLIRLCNFNIV